MAASFLSTLALYHVYAEELASLLILGPGVPFHLTAEASAAFSSTARSSGLAHILPKPDMSKSDASSRTVVLLAFCAWKASSLSRCSRALDSAALVSSPGPRLRERSRGGWTRSGPFVRLSVGRHLLAALSDLSSLIMLWTSAELSSGVPQNVQGQGLPSGISLCSRLQTIRRGSLQWVRAATRFRGGGLRSPRLSWAAWVGFVETSRGPDRLIQVRQRRRGTLRRRAPGDRYLRGLTLRRRAWRRGARYGVGSCFRLGKPRDRDTSVPAADGGGLEDEGEVMAEAVFSQEEARWRLRRPYIGIGRR